MGKKKNKKKLTFSDRLAISIQNGDVQDVLPEAAGQGLSEDRFLSAFERSKAIHSRGTDPREIVSLPNVFQQAFLRIAYQNEDEDTVLDIYSMSQDKETKKEAKGVLHRFRSRGIDVPQPEDATPSILQKRIIEENQPLANFISPVTSRGSRMVWLVTYVRGGVGVFQAEINDVDGLIEFSGGVIGRSRYRDLSKDMFNNDRLSILEISYAEAKTWISKAAELSRSTGRTVPEQYLEASSILPEPTHTAEPPNFEEMFNPQSSEDPSSSLQQTADLHELAEFADWIPSDESIKILHNKLQEIETGKIAINLQQRADQINKALDQAVIDMLGDATEKEKYQNRLFQMALHFQRTNQSDRARLCAAAARQLSEPQFEPLNSPFFCRLVRKMFKSPEEIAKHMQPENPPTEPEQDPGNLIVTP